MKDWVKLEDSQWFWTWDPWIGNPTPWPLGHCFILIASSTLKFLILQINDFKYPWILACGYEFYTTTVLQHFPCLKHHPPPTPWFFTIRSRVKESLSTPRFRQRNLSLTALPDSPHWLTTKTERWNTGLNSRTHFFE